MQKFKRILMWLGTFRMGWIRPYSLPILLTIILACSAFALVPGQAIAQDEVPTPTIPIGAGQQAETEKTPAVAAPTAQLPAEPQQFQPVTPMGALLSAAIVPLFEDINPDSSTLDATNPNGASGGRCNGLASVAGDNQTFYLASEWGGLYKSTDGGLTWDYLEGHLPVVTWDVEVDPGSTNTVYATSFYDGRVDSISGIQMSSDAGTAWIHPATTQPNDPADEGTGADNTPQPGYSCSAARRTEPSAFGIAIRPDISNNVIIGTNCGVAISADSGATWQFRDPDPSDAALNVWDAVYQPAMTGFPNGIIDICGDEGHFRSTDGGVIWTASAGNLPTGRCSIAVSPDEDYVLFVAASDNNLYESDDAGATWTNLGNPQAQGRIPFVTTNQRSDNPGPTDVFNMWFGDVQLFRADCTSQTAQGGANRCPGQASWTNVQTGAHWDSGDVVFDTQAANDACPMLYTNDGGVYYNTDMTAACHNPNWEQPNVTPHALWLFGMDGADQPGDDNEDLYFGCQDTGSFATIDAGAASPTWFNRQCCDSFDMAAEPARILYSLGFFSPGRGFRLFLRNTGMTGGGEINTYPADGLIPSFLFPDMADNFGDREYVVLTNDCNPGVGGCPGTNAGDGGIYITNDITAGPIVWTELGNATEPPSNRICAVQAAVAADDIPTFYVQEGNCDGRSQDRLWIFTGTDPTGTWQRIDTNLASGGIGIFAVDPNDPDRLYASNVRSAAAGGPQMVFSNDGGTTWNNDAELDNLMQGGGLFKYQTFRGPTNFTGFGGYPQPSLLAFDPEYPDIIVAGGRDSGVFISRNDGNRWDLLTDPFDPVNSGIPHLPRPWFAYFDHEPADSGEVRIFIGTQGRGVWRISVPIDVPVISVPGSVVFTDTCVGETSSATLNVCNTGGGEENLVVDAITSTDPQFSVTEPSSGFPVEISPDFCFPFEAVFSPNSQGTHSAILSIESNDPVDPILEVQATGDGTNPQISTLIADNGNFGNVCLGDFKDLDLTINNSGACYLSISNISSSSPDFITANTISYPLVIAPGTSLAVPIRFEPTSFGDKNALISINSNDPDTPIKNVAVSGKTAEPDINIVIEENGDFGDLCEDDQKDIDLRIKNQGDCDLEIASITSSDPNNFVVDQSLTFPIVLKPGETLKSFIRFKPDPTQDCDDNTPRTANITVVSNDPDSPTVKSVMGKVLCPNLVLDPPDLTGLFAFPPTVTDTGGVLGCFSDQTVRITNDGFCPLKIDDITATAPFAVIDPTVFPIVLQPNVDQLNVTVRFAPLAGGPVDVPDETTGILQIASNDPDPADTMADLCGEPIGEQAGLRVLGVDRRSGLPISNLDSIKLKRGTNLIVKETNVPLMNTTICGNTVLYHLHREQLLPKTYKVIADEFIMPHPWGGDVILRGKKRIPLAPCQFEELVLKMKLIDP